MKLGQALILTPLFQFCGIYNFNVSLLVSDGCIMIFCVSHALLILYAFDLFFFFL